MKTLRNIDEQKYCVRCIHYLNDPEYSMGYQHRCKEYHDVVDGTILPCCHARGPNFCTASGLSFFPIQKKAKGGKRK
jgi:hypothetical protein